MNRKILKDFSILLTLILLTFVIIFFFVKFINKSLENDETNKTPGATIEKPLGKLVRQQLLIDTKIADLPATQEAIGIMKDFLLKDKKPLPFDIELILVDSNIINAFALPGGTLIIYSGLIKAADDPREIMSVLAHELGHIFYRDSYNSLIRSIGISVVISAVTGNSSEIVVEIINNLLSTSYSRKVESRADDFALELLASQGIDPVYMASFFKNLQVIYGKDDEKSTLLQYFRTHPSTNERIEKAQKASLNFSSGENQPIIDWDKVLGEQSSFF